MSDPTQVDVVQVGKVMATLDDVRLIIYVLIVVIVVLIMERVWTAAGVRAERRDMRAEREKMWEVADKFGSAAEKVGEQTDKLVVELQVLRALSSRVESHNV